MKLRLHGNSLRLRLNQADVAQFSKTGYLEETVEFGPGASFCYHARVVLESCLAAGHLPKWRTKDSDILQSGSGMGHHGPGRRLGRPTVEWRQDALHPDRKRFQVHPQRRTGLRRLPQPVGIGCARLSAPNPPPTAHHPPPDKIEGDYFLLGGARYVPFRR